MLAPIVVGAAALGLYLLGSVPAHLQGAPGVTEFRTVERAELELGFQIAVPTYFPSYLSWPPAKIEGQLEPLPQVQLLFLASDQQTEALLIVEIVSGSEDLPVPVPWVETIADRTPVSINGYQGELMIGRRADGRLVNSVHWLADGRHFIVVTTHPVRELLTLAGSMRP